MRHLAARFFGLYCLLLKLVQTWAGLGTNFTLSHYKAQREKRTLIFEGGGQIKFVIGPTLPVNLGDPIVWRSLICSYNLHGGHYPIPTEPLYPWDKYEDIFARSMRKLQTHDAADERDGVRGVAVKFAESLENAAAEKYWSDDSRIFVYKALEDFLSRQKQINGHVCLLRSICENAQIQQHIGIFAELLNVVLTPGKEKIDNSYVEAYEAGKTGADCLRLFKDCPMGSNILDTYLEYL